MLRRTESPIASTLPIQAFSTKSFSALVVTTTMFGRNRRTSKRPSGQYPKAIDRGRSQKMHEGAVEKGTLRQAKIGGRVLVIEVLDVRPVLLSHSRLYIWQSG